MAVDMFFKIGDKIKGETVDAGKDALGAPLKDQIDILSWDWGMNQTATLHHATGGGAGKVNVKDLTMTKYVDLATADLIKACCAGTHFPKALLTVRKAGGDPMIYFWIEFEKVLVSSHSIAGTDGDRLVETVTINFSKFTVTYAKQDDKGKAAGSIKGGFDIALNKAV